jgi:c(7)-type cytochrome triheme protein
MRGHHAVNVGARKWGRSRKYILLLPLFFAVSCSGDTLSLFFDVPPPSEKPAPAPEQTPAPAPVAAAPAGQAITQPEGGPPEFEKTLNWEEAVEMLPKDDIDYVDWMAALREGIIKPRAEMTGPGNPTAGIFKYDFYFQGPDPEFDAFFPHSSHTQWLTCESCHPAIFQYRELGFPGSERFGIAMDQIFNGEFCGQCHGVVAFPLDSCNRCHTKLE